MEAHIPVLFLDLNGKLVLSLISQLPFKQISDTTDFHTTSR